MIERERERERERYIYIYIYTYTHIFRYMYIYVFLYRTARNPLLLVLYKVKQDLTHQQYCLPNGNHDVDPDDTMNHNTLTGQSLY